eukprot:19681_1
MGSLLGLCIPDGQPCSGSEAVARRQNNKRGRDPQKQRLISSMDSATSDSSISQGSVLRAHSRDTSIYTVPTKKIMIAPVIAKHIFLNETFIEIRKKMEQNALKSEDIDTVLYRTDFWFIQGPDALALEDHRELFDIVIWRVPTIPAFAHFDNEEQFYDKLLNGNKGDTQYSEGIWAVLSKEKFIQMFDAKLLDEIDEIKDETHSYLADEVKFPHQSDEYKTLIDKLKVIEEWKKANDIIIMGQKTCVKDLLRVIRQQEVDHSSMLSMFKVMMNKKCFEWEIKSYDANAHDPNVIVSYWCVVSNIPLRCGQLQLHELLSDYPRWTYADIINESTSDRDHEEAKIEFDDEKCLTTFIKDVEKGSVYLGGYQLSIHSHEKEIKQKKIRRFDANDIIV